MMRARRAIFSVTPTNIAAGRLNRLQPSGALPTVWIPPANCRISVTGRAPGWCSSRHTQLKNRIHATWATYALHDLDVSDLFGAPGRDLLRPRLPLLPPHTA